MLSARAYFVVSAGPTVVATLLACTALVGQVGEAPAWLAAAIGLPLGIALSLRWRLSPRGLEAFLASHRRLAVIAALLSVFSVVHTARQSAYVIDSSARWGRALPTDGGQHLCLAAYLRGAELATSGREVYRDGLYARGTSNSSEIVGLGAALGDPYAYPPQALLLPKLALMLSSRLQSVRVLWYVVSGAAFLLAAFWLVTSFVGESRLWGHCLVPAVWASLPVAYNFEYGQVHLLAIAMSVAAMLAFRKGRRWGGALLLAVAISWKLFPALLLVHLAMQKRFRDVMATLALSLLLTAVAWLVLGTDVFIEFITVQLPRLADGSAFDRFFAGDPTSQLSPSGLIRVLGFDELSNWLGRLLPVLTLAFMWRAIRQGRGDSPPIWMAVANLAALHSPFAPASYAAAGVLWLLAWILHCYRGSFKLIWGVAGAWLFVQSAPFVDDLPGLYDNTKVLLATSFVSVAIALAACFIPLWTCANDEDAGPE